MRRVLFLLLATAPLASHAEELGRFFFTPQERQALDAQHAVTPPAASPSDTGAASAGNLGPSIAVQGVVKRSSGKFTAWVNGTPYDESSAGQLLRAPGKNGAITITSPETKRPLTLKAGQTVNVGNGAITDVFQPAPPAGNQ